MIAEQDQKLPTGWALSKLGDLVEEIKTKSSELDPNDEFFYIDIASIDNELKKITNPKRYQWKNAPSRAKQIIKANDIVFSTVRTYLKNIALVPVRLDGQVASTGFCVIRGGEAVRHNFLFYYTLSRHFIESLNKLQRGTSYPAVRDRDVFAQILPLPPLAEQYRIVDKIEELFSDLDNGINSLKIARQQLKVYRQAVLKWAFEGKLTAQWREEQKRLGKLESAEVLLAQIKAEREQRYQQELEDWKTAIALWEANGKEGKKPGKPSELMRILPLSSDELNDLSELPQEWKWVRYGSLCREIRNGISTKPNSDNAEKILRISSVRPFYIDLSDFRHIENLNGIYDNYFLQVGDILFTRYNGSRHYVGVCANFKSNKRFLYPDKLIRTRLISDSLVLPDYIVFAANSGKSRTYIERQIKTTAGQSGISGQDIKLFPIPLCASQEQRIICDEINTRFSIRPVAF